MCVARGCVASLEGGLGGWPGGGMVAPEMAGPCREFGRNLAWVIYADKWRDNGQTHGPAAQPPSGP